MFPIYALLKDLSIDAKSIAEGGGGKAAIIVHAKLHSQVASEVFYVFVKGRGGTWGIASFAFFFLWLSAKKGT